jgi:hypothetical protein
MFGDRKKVG